MIGSSLRENLAARRATLMQGGKAGLHAVASEGDTIGFAVGFLLIVVGVGMVSVPAAFVLAGILICCGTAALSLVRMQKRKRES